MSVRSTPRNHGKRDMGGVWQPYVPQIGVPRGCRTDLRNPNEIFRINHLSQKINETGINVKRTTELANAAKSSLHGASVTPVEDTTEKASSVPRTSAASKSSLGSGVVPVVDNKVYSTRPQQGRINEQSRHQDSAPSRRTNNETLRPPDNIAMGLIPLVDRDEDMLKQSRSHIASTASSLGPGLLPVCVMREIEQSHDLHNPDLSDTPYMRVYGCKN